MQPHATFTYRQVGGGGAEDAGAVKSRNVTTLSKIEKVFNFASAGERFSPLFSQREKDLRSRLNLVPALPSDTS
jgi:hypothetical protein